MPTGTAFCTWTTRQVAADAGAAVSSPAAPNTAATPTVRAVRESALTRPWCPTAPSPPSMPGEVDDLLEGRPVLPVQRPGADDAGGDRRDVVKALVVGQLVDRRDVLCGEGALHGGVQRGLQRGPA